MSKKNAAGPLAGTEPAVTGPPRLTYQVKQLQEALRVRLDKITQQFRLTPKQYTALTVLAMHPGISASELARLTFVSPQAANEMVTTLERKSFLTRSVDERNKRYLGVALTPAGGHALSGCDQQVEELEATVFTGFDSAQRAAFRLMLETCLEALSSTA